ncbi:hypothetical protein [Alcanivorax sp.]|uniref:hypothetical protein n=1 Tax=Alcanivorax sp. TaxID=1872427 RepID=UPI0025B83B33|nr:hypothetical protein [Alcanivorax sp.]
MTLGWNGSSLGVENRGDAITTSAVAAFKVTNVRAVNYPKPHVGSEFFRGPAKAPRTSTAWSLNGKAPRLEVDGKSPARSTPRMTRKRMWR